MSTYVPHEGKIFQVQQRKGYYQKAQHVARYSTAQQVCEAVAKRGNSCNGRQTGAKAKSPRYHGKTLDGRHDRPPKGQEWRFDYR